MTKKVTALCRLTYPSGGPKTLPGALAAVFPDVSHPEKTYPVARRTSNKAIIFFICLSPMLIVK